MCCVGVFTKFGSYRLSEVINEQGMTDGTQQLRVSHYCSVVSN